MAIDLNKTLLSRLSAYTLAGAKSLWSATVQTAWGFATFFLLAALLAYYEMDTTAIAPFFTIITTLMDNWQIAFGVLFVFELIVNYNSLTEERK